ncbi:MAG TPA: DUF1349 domain-containing protein, partial [Verrucomicrobiae bacterium]
AAEAASILQLTEAATHKRTNRALDKLRKIFSKQGVSSTTSIIAGAISAHSIHPAPAALAASVKLAAAAKGAAAGASVATLIHGGLKLMAWTKARTTIAIGLGLLLTAGTTALLIKQISRPPDMAILQGTWTGQEARAGTSPSTVTIRGANLEFRSADGYEWYKATFSLRVNTSPRQFVLVLTDCSAPEYVGKTAYAIYQMQGDAFTIAAGEPGVSPVPASFDTPGTRKFVFKKTSERALATAANTPPEVVNAHETPQPAEIQNSESIPGWGNVINPDGDCTLTVADGKLTVNLPGTDHALMPERAKKNAPRILQELNVPFDVQVKLSEHFTRGAQTIVAGRKPYQDAGLLVWLDDQNNLKLARAHIVRDGKSFLFFHLEFRHSGQYGEIPLPNEANRLLSSKTVYLRLQLHKDQTTASVSADGVKWISASLPGGDPPEKMQVGLIAENNTTSPLTVGFEEFALTKK